MSYADGNPTIDRAGAASAPAARAAALYGRFAALVTVSTKAALILIVSVMCLLVFAQVVTRYLLESTPAFLSELATYCLIWTGCIGSSLAFRYRKHVAVEILPGHLSANGRRRLAGVNAAALVVFLVVFFYSSLVFALDMWEQYSATMDISMTYPALGLPIGTALMIVQVLDVSLNPGAQ